MDQDMKLFWKFKEENDLEAWSILDERYRAMLYGYAFRRVGHRDLAEEMVQDVFLHLIDPKLPCPKEGAFKAYVFRALSNRIADHYRALKRRPPPEPVYDDEVLVKGPGPEAEAESAETRDHVGDCVERLPPREREVVKLYYFGDQTLSQIAHAQGFSVATAHRVLRRAHDLLLGWLGP